MERSPDGWHSRRRPATGGKTPSERGHRRSRRLARRVATAASIAAAVGLAVPASISGSASASPRPTLKELLAQAAKLSRQIDSLSQQFDALRIQYDEAKAQVKVARLTVRRDQRLLKADQAAIAQIAAAGYMTGGVNPAISLLTSKNPESMLNRASILGQLQKENGAKLHLVSTARAAAQRAKLLATQQQSKAAKLSKAMKAKVAVIQAKENKLNTAAYAKALEIYRKTGTYPPIQVNGRSLGVQALRIAMTKIGDPYVWGAAGPNSFDCSGLVMWAYAQLGISLPHFTGAQWNSGVHVPRSQLQPGDLLFFYSGISHVGIYVGNGFMLDAPTFGIPVGIHPVMWDVFDGGVRIA
ncbi:MAG TPA: NlpC/P60 family protein [Streptosporangiaceae bacterium]|nr:NlpC/P60 family protein [Streptosporangiaceae bacterium]